MKWNFHDLTVAGSSNHTQLMDAWKTSFASRVKPANSADSADISIQLDVVDEVPAQPAGEPQFSTTGDFLHYYVYDDQVTAHFPKFGQLYLDLATGTTTGKVIEAALNTYGVLEDLVAISLSPHLRRKGYFLIHAFAAAFEGKAVIIVGGIGAGKTTTGMSLLNAGWQLLSNDSPIVAKEGQILSYPGVLAGYPETFARFERTAHLADQVPEMAGRKKLLVSAESVFPDVWLDAAPIAAIIFPQIEQIDTHTIDPIGKPEALRRLLPHAVEQWDKPMIPRHFSILRQLSDAAPAYVMRLSPDVLAIPTALAAIL